MMKEERKNGELQKNSMEKESALPSENFWNHQNSSSDYISSETVYQLGLAKNNESILKNQKREKDEIFKIDSLQRQSSFTCSKDNHH